MSKYCSICGDKCGLFSRWTLKNGLICKRCRSKLSYWFLKSGKRLSSCTIADINEQLRYREGNQNLLKLFHPTRQVQLKDETFLKVDDAAEKFMVVNQREDPNPDVLDFSMFLGCVVDSEEKEQKYKPENERPYYKTRCRFNIVMQVDTPYYTKINLERKLSVCTSESVSDFGGRLLSGRERLEYEKYEEEKRAIKKIEKTVNDIFAEYHKKQEAKEAERIELQRKKEAERIELQRKKEAERIELQRKNAIDEKIREVADLVTEKFDEAELLRKAALSAQDKVKEYGRLRQFCLSYIPELGDDRYGLVSALKKCWEYVNVDMCSSFENNWKALSKAFFQLNRGIQGENHVEEVLSLYDDRICFIRNHTWIYEHDFIVLAPSGIYTIEVKMLSDDYVLTETGMLKPLNDPWKRTSDVVLQSRKHVETLRKGLKECAAYTSDIPITEIICCADGNHIIKNEFPDMIVCYCNTLNKYLFPDNAENKLTAERMAELKDFLLQNGEKEPRTYSVFGDKGDLPDRDEFVRNFAYTVGAKYVQEHFDSF